jgi:hypothetical protein
MGVIGGTVGVATGGGVSGGGLMGGAVGVVSGGGLTGGTVGVGGTVGLGTGLIVEYGSCATTVDTNNKNSQETKASHRNLECIAELFSIRVAEVPGRGNGQLQRGSLGTKNS